MNFSVLRSMTLLFVIFFTISACENRLSTEELSDQIEINMMGEGGQFKEKNIKIMSFALVREGNDSNKYSGILKTQEPNGKFTYVVNVTYDGENFAWEVEE